MSVSVMSYTSDSRSRSGRDLKVSQRSDSQSVKSVNTGVNSRPSRVISVMSTATDRSSNKPKFPEHLRRYIAPERPLQLPPIQDRRTFVPSDYPQYEPVLWAASWLLWNAKSCPPRDTHPAEVPQQAYRHTIKQGPNPLFKLMKIGGSVECKRISNCMKNFNVNFAPNRFSAWLQQAQTMQRVPREVSLFPEWYSILADRLSLEYLKTSLGISEGNVKFEQVEETISYHEFSADMVDYIVERALGYFDGEKVFSDAFLISTDLVFLTFLPVPWFPPIVEKTVTLKNIVRFEAHNCCLSSVEGLDLLVQLEYIDISSNRLYDLPEGFGGTLERLTTLILSGNRLSTITPELGFCRFLMTLHLSNNLISELPNMSRMQKLNDLDLSYNPIAVLPISIVPLRTTIKKLNVCYTNVDMSAVMSIFPEGVVLGVQSSELASSGEGKHNLAKLDEGFVKTAQYTTWKLRWLRAILVVRAVVRFLSAARHREEEIISGTAVDSSKPFIQVQRTLVGNQNKRTLYLARHDAATYKVYGGYVPFR